MNLHFYLALNIVIAGGYLVGRVLAFKIKASKIQQLRFARYAFLISIVSCLFMPIVLSNISTDSNYKFIPVLKNISDTFIKETNFSETKLVITYKNHYPSLSIIDIVQMFFIIGIIFSTYQFVKNLIILKNIHTHSFCRHYINSVRILISSTVKTPFCWSFFKNHFIAIPLSLLEKNSDLKIAVKHELQHLRQGDTNWLNFLAVIKIFLFWNPFITLWINWFNELQEFSCDETLILKKKASPITYAQCLINAASKNITKDVIPQGTLGVHHLSKSMLYRRVNMLFSYKKFQSKKSSIVFSYLISFAASASAALAFAGSPSRDPLTIEQVKTIIEKSHLNAGFNVSATPAVVEEINNIRSSEQARSFMQSSLQRMKNYQSTIKKSLNKNAMPNDLMVVPLVESGYKPLDQSKNPVLAAGIWQIVPSTAKRYGLTINAHQDDRLNTELSTEAAIAYLKDNYKQFDNWKLAIVAYEIGEKSTEQLIKKTSSQDAWVIAQSPTAPESLKNFLAMVDASLIVMHNPSLIN